MFPPSDFTLYQSTQSLGSTLSTSSGYPAIPQPPVTQEQLEQAADAFRMQWDQEAAVLEDGTLNLTSFTLQKPILAGLLQDFVTMTELFILWHSITQTWPKSDVLEALAVLAIGVVLLAYSKESDGPPTENCKY